MQNISQKIMSEVVTYMKYAKFIPKESRRETWEEIILKNIDMHVKKFPKLKKEILENYKLVFDKNDLPSMRSLQFAGKPVKLNPTRIYNCSFLHADAPEIFSEIMFLLLSGVGVGYSIQRHHIEKLPEIKKSNKTRRFVVGDSIEGWSDCIAVLMRAYFEGKPIPEFDYDDIRPKGALLVTSGGKAPGPEPLKACVANIEQLLKNKDSGDKLEAIEVHDIICYIANAVLAGGIRRSALISLFSLDDMQLIKSKLPFKAQTVQYIAYHNSSEYPSHEINVNYTDETCNYQNTNATIFIGDVDYSEYLKTGKLPYYYFHEKRGRANNSAVILKNRIKKKEFFKLWDIIKSSGNGEPGLYFTDDVEYGTNPCVETSLRTNTFCNLVEVDVSEINSQEELNQRVKAAAFINTLQASYTDFHYLRPVWIKNTRKDSLIGVGLTGIGSGKILNFDLKIAAQIVLDENERVAELIGINKAARCTVIKPSGTASLVLGCSSGIHAWHSPYYIRRIRVGKDESINTYLEINHPELLEQDELNPNQNIICIPQKAPDGSIFRNERAIDLLERTKKFNIEWIRTAHRSGPNYHNVSATISIKDSEWDEVGNWMWENKEFYHGLSTLPYHDAQYIQAPFQEITKEEYEERFKHLHDIDLSKVVEFKDETNLQGEAACAGGACEVV